MVDIIKPKRAPYLLEFLIERRIRVPNISKLFRTKRRNARKSDFRSTGIYRITDCKDTGIVYTDHISWIG